MHREAEIGYSVRNEEVRGRVRQQTQNPLWESGGEVRP
jgi:hypothetical protein